MEGKRKALAQHSAKPTIVGGQPPGQWQRPLSGIPVGVERVLFEAALDQELLTLLLHDRDRALSRFPDLRPAELAVLRGIGEPQLRATVAAIDTSAENVRRRSFLKAVAAAAAGVALVEGTSACTGSRPDEPKKDGGADEKDAEPVHDGPPAATGVRPG
jgi:hypothetical protein